MNTLYHQYENRMKDSAMVDAVRIGLDGGTLTEADLTALKAEHPGYTAILEHTLVLYKPPVDPAEALKEKLDSIAEALPDEIAIEHIDLYPVWQAGMRLEAEARVRYESGLYRVQQAHTAEHPPGVITAALYTRIQAPGSVEPWSSGQSYAEGVRVTHKGKTWESKVPNNIWEPGAVGVLDTIWEEVAE